MQPNLEIRERVAREVRRPGGRKGVANHAPVICACGCGKEVVGDSRGRKGRYRPGHYSRTEQYRRVARSVDPERTKHSGPDNGNWKGGRGIDAQGYVRVRVGGKQVREHRIIAAQKIGRPLKRGEVVHHTNGVRSDNRPENLEVLESQSVHMSEHMTPEEASRRGKAGARTRRAALAAIESEKTR